MHPLHVQYLVCVAVDPFTYEGHIKKTTAVVNLKGAVDIMISPLMLEALQRLASPCENMRLFCFNEMQC